MITLPDFKEKQILFIQIDIKAENKIKFSNENILFLKDNKIINRASCHKVFVVFVIGDISITTVLLREASKYGISMFFMKNNFESYATVNSKSEGNYLLKERQYKMTKKYALELSKNIVKNKIRNQMFLLGKNNKDKEKIFNQIEKVDNIKSLLGLEGNVSKEFFKEFFKEVGWFRRMPRVKPDISNFLLDLGYTILFNFIDSLLLLYGFDTYKGFYHQLFFQRKSLTCDIVEPFRSIIDKQLLKSYNLKQINENDFIFKNGKYSIKFEKGQKYSQIFAQSIMDNKENIYLFIQSFYRSLMNDKNNFNKFKIK